MSAIMLQMLAAGGSAADTTAPTITSSNAVSVAENVTLSHSLTADESVTWSIVGGADQSKLEISGSTLRWASNGTKDYEAPDDADTNNTYIVTVRATDLASNTTDQTITVTVTNANATWDSATATAVTLSGGDLVATNTGTTSANQGAHVASSAGKSSGKHYFEFTATTWTAGNNVSCGVGTTASSYSNIGANATTGGVIYRSGNMWANGTGHVGWGTIASNDIIGVAVDIDNGSIWFKRVGGGTVTNWNNSGTANPATNTGGWSIPAGTYVPFCTFGGTSGVANNVTTANFGGGFTGSVPSGFTSGWTV